MLTHRRTQLPRPERRRQLSWRPRVSRLATPGAVCLIADAGNLHVFDALPRRERGAGKKGLAHLSAHELVGDARTLCHVDCRFRRAGGGLRLQRADQIPFDTDELQQTVRFDPPVFRRYEWTQSYSTSAYLEVLQTYSNHRLLPADARDGLLACVAELINTRYGGAITKRYMTELRLARRRT